MKKYPKKIRKSAIHFFFSKKQLLFFVNTKKRIIFEVVSII